MKYFFYLLMPGPVFVMTSVASLCLMIVYSNPIFIAPMIGMGVCAYIWFTG